MRETSARQRPRALITGATAGIGRTFAERLASRGHDVIAVARDAARLEALGRELESRYGARVDVIRADLSSDEQTTRLVEWIASNGPLDVLVNNAGFGTKGAIHRTSPEGQEAMIRVHVMAPMRLTQAALPAMVARGSGAVINVSSVASFTASAGNANYCATKTYLRVFSQAVAAELRGTGVYVQALCPGFTHTEFHDRLRVSKTHVPSWVWMSAERVVDDSIAAMERRGPVVVVPGLGYRVLVAMLRHAPSWMLTKATRKYRRD